jgi:nucleoside-diphosphate-sugar epimerase
MTAGAGRREGPPVLVTGATGFVGGLVAARLLAEGQDVRALARRDGDPRLSVWGPAGPPAPDAPPPPGRLTVAVGDLGDRDALARAADGCEVVYHVAGLNTLCPLDPKALYEVNVEGTRRMLDAARAAGVRRLVLTSSAGVLGGDSGEAVGEDAPPPAHLPSEYARSKLAAERLALAFDGIEVVAVNPSSVQGPGRRTGTAKLLLDYLNGKLPVSVPSTFGLCYTDDCASGHLLAAAAGHPGRRYVLNSTTVTTAQAFGLVAELVGLPRGPRELPPPLAMGMAAAVEAVARARGRQPSLCREAARTMLHPHVYDGSRAERELGVAYTPLQTALERTVRWYAAAGLLKRPLPGLPALVARKEHT